MTGSVCPYCGTVLEPKPTRKKKCPHCKNYVFVRRGNLFTEQGLKEYEAQEREEWTIKRWVDQLDQFGIAQVTFEHQREELSKRFGSRASVYDTIWQILNGLISPSRSRFESKMIYFLMASVMREEGRNPTPYFRQAATQELLEISEGAIFSRVKISTCNDDHVCVACREAAEKTYTIEQALSQLPVPNVC